MRALILIAVVASLLLGIIMINRPGLVAATAGVEKNEAASRQTAMPEAVDIVGLASYAETTIASSAGSTDSSASYANLPLGEIHMGHIAQVKRFGDSYVLTFKDGSSRSLSASQLSHLPGELSVRLEYNRENQ